MTEREIIKRLKESGWEITEGSRHHLATSINFPGKKIPIPRHKGDIPKGTAEGILKQAGIK
ncbi:MAG: type II toxin-antitoxin system HicA family toxin [Clostridia bacterium]